MKLNSQHFLPVLLYLSCLTDKIYSEEQVAVDIAGRLARMLCMQYSMEGATTKTTMPKAHKRPLYKVQDAPCRLIHRRVCGGSADCQKFSSKRKQPCDEEAKMMEGEYGEYYGGDIVNVPKQERGGVSDKGARWPNRTKIGDTGGPVSPIIPYKFGDDVEFQHEHTMKQAMGYIESCTCIRFEKRQANKPEHKDWLYIKSTQQGCFSTDIGRGGEQQTVNVDSNCMYGSMIHELLHVIGFDHEQSRSDRDNHVTILRDNIKPETLRNFEKLSKSQWESSKEKYDYNSIMHYHQRAFAKQSGLKTIELKDTSAHVGQREAMSRSDVIQVNRMYGCSDEIRTGCKTYN